MKPFEKNSFFNRYSIILAILCFGLTVYSQNEIKWSTSFNDRLTPRHSILFGDKVFSARVNTNNSSVASYSQTTLYRFNSNLEIEHSHFEKLLFGGEKMIFEQFVIINDELYAQLYIPAKGKVNKAIFLSQIDTSTLEFSQNIFPLIVDISRDFSTPIFETTQSPDSNLVLFTAIAKNKKEKIKYARFLIIDQNKKILRDTLVKLNYTNNRYKNSRLIINNKGDVFLLGYNAPFSTTKKERAYFLLKFEFSSQSFSSQMFDQHKNDFILSLEMEIIEDNLVIGGFFSNIDSGDKVRGYVFSKTNIYSNDIISFNYRFFLSSGNIPHKAQTPSRLVYPDLEIKHIFEWSNDLNIIIGEQKRFGNEIIQPNFGKPKLFNETNTPILFGDIIIIAIDDKGIEKWSSVVSNPKPASFWNPRGNFLLSKNGIELRMLSEQNKDGLVLTHLDKEGNVFSEKILNTTKTKELLRPLSTPYLLSKRSHFLYYNKSRYELGILYMP